MSLNLDANGNLKRWSYENMERFRQNSLTELEEMSEAIDQDIDEIEAALIDVDSRVPQFEIDQSRRTLVISYPTTTNSDNNQSQNDNSENNET